MKENLLFVLTHPFLALRTKARQMAVESEIGHASPPEGSTIESFPKLSIERTARLLRPHSGGVQLEDWPPSVRAKMLVSKENKIVQPMEPDGRHPEHPYV